jgi:hypothetical protein
MVTPDDSSRWDDPEALDDEYAEDVALEGADDRPYDPPVYGDPTDRGDGTKTADPGYGTFTHHSHTDGDLLGVRVCFVGHDDLTVVRKSDHIRHRFLDMTGEEIYLELLRGRLKLRMARTPTSAVKAERELRADLVRLSLDDLWHIRGDVLRAHERGESYWLVTQMVRVAQSWKLRGRVGVKHHVGPEVRAVVLGLHAADWSYRRIERVTGVPKSNAARWVSHFSDERLSTHRGGKVKAELPTIIERVASLEQQVIEHDDRLTETERQLGLPPGGEKAAARVVEQLIAEVHTEED